MEAMDEDDDDEEIEAPPRDPTPPPLLDDALLAELECAAVRTGVSIPDDPALLAAMAEAAQDDRRAPVAAARPNAPLRDLLLATGMPFVILNAGTFMEKEETVLLSGDRYRACAVSPIFIHLLDVVLAGQELKAQHKDYQAMDRRTLMAALVMTRADDAHTLLPREPPGAGGKITDEVRARCADYVAAWDRSLILCLDASDDAHIWSWAGSDAPFDWLMIHGICQSVFPLPSKKRSKLDRAAVWAAFPRGRGPGDELKLKFDSLFSELALL